MASRNPPRAGTIAVVNPNASERVTGGIAEHLQRCVPGRAFECLTSHDAPPVIETLEDLARSERVLADAVPAGSYAAIVVAGFLDPGVHTLRARHDVPVLGMGSMALFSASSFGRFGIVTVRQALIPPTRDFVAAHGLAGQCAGVVSVDVGVAASAAEGVDVEMVQSRLNELKAAGAAAICLGSGSLVHLTLSWAPLAPVPLIDGISQAVTLACALGTGPSPAPPESPGA